MNRNILKWVLIAAVIIGAAAYFILSEMPSGQRQGKQGKEKIVVGNSKAFEIEPIEGITISATENALDKDREFKLTVASEKQWKHDAKVVEKQFGANPFLVFELDAGMKSDEMLPGTYTVQMDFKKMGIPEKLWTDVRAYRIAGSDCYQYHSRVNKDGIFAFESNQNSGVALAVLFANYAWQSFGYSLFLVLGKGIHDAIVKSDIKSYFKDVDDVMIVPIDDPPYGSFNLYFRWSDTKNGKEAKKAFEENEEKAMNRLEELEKEAEIEYERRINKMATGRDNLSWFETIANKARRDEAKEKLEKESVLKELVGQDSILRKLNAEPASQLPIEVEKNIEQIKIANKYLSQVEKLKPLTYSISIFLMDALTMGTDRGLNNTPMVGHCYVKVNMESGMLKGEWANTPARSQSALLTIVHELYHSRQQSNYTFVRPMKMLPSESTAAVLESDAARWFYHNGRIVSVDIDGPNGNEVELTGRDKHFLFAVPLDKISTKIDAEDAAAAASLSYTLADVIEAVRNAAGKKNVGMVRFCDEYKASRPFSELIKKALDIDDATLDKGWNLMIDNKIGTISYKQIDAQTTNNTKYKECWVQEHTFTESSPILNIKAEKAKYYAKSWYFYFKDCPGKPNVFILPEKEGAKIRFYLKNGDFKDGKETPRMYADDQPYKMFMSVGDLGLSGKKEDYEYKVVAFFAPEAPKIRKVKDDQISFVMPKPDRDLTKNKFITGAVVTYTDANGQTLTHNVDPKHFGKKVKWTVPGCSKSGTGFTLSLHWYFDVDENTTYVSPESELVKWGEKAPVMPEEKKEEKAPETNYWKLVDSRGSVVSTSKEIEIGNDNMVSSDYRSVKLTKESGGKSLEFEGMASTEEVSKEGGRTYVKDLYLEGTLTYTEPPKAWRAGTEYKGTWAVEDDPYLMRIKEPFEFVATVTSSAEKACVKSHREKTDMGRSKEGGVKWLRNYSVTYMARHPEKDDPRAFTLTQTFTIAERPGSNLKATIVQEYDYEWIGEPEEEVKEEDLGNLGIGIEFPMNAKDKAYFGEHGGSLLHRNDFGVKIPSGSYSVKKSGKGYILEGIGHHEGSRPRASHNIEVRIVLDKNKIPVEASFSCQGFYEGTIRTMKTETTTFQATGTAKLTEKGPGPNARRGKCTSFNGIIHTESEGDFDYSNTEGGHLNIFWKRD